VAWSVSFSRSRFFIAVLCFGVPGRRGRLSVELFASIRIGWRGSPEQDSCCAFLRNDIKFG
jgi:hypothetical protein